MRYHNRLIILISLMLFQACVLQSPSKSRKSLLNSNSTTTTTPTPTQPTFTSDENLYWFTTYKVTGTITLNKNSQDIIYLRGKNIHDFLSTKDLTGTEYYKKQFCLVGSFALPTYKQTRVRAIPLTVTNPDKSTERLLRIDYPGAVDNATACNNTTIFSVAPNNAAYSFPEICSNCTGQINTSSVNLFEVKYNSQNQSQSLSSVDSNLINLSLINIRVDLQSNSTSPVSECTNSSCGAKGFDCCISGQCVKDGSEKINASTYPEYTQAKSDFTKNPLSFINYPNIYYICSNIAHTPVNTTPTTSTPLSTAQARVAAYLTDYTCINNFEIGNGYISCGDKTESAFIATKKKLAIACGCNASPDQMDVKCPDWGVIPIYKVGAPQTIDAIIDFNCYTPQPPNPIGPITNLNVAVPNRSSPHRFYSANGSNYDDLTGLLKKSPTLLQEGEDFFYIDEFNKVGPVSGSYNINSILGKMTIDLTHTLPAKVVNVELGKSYILSATSGYFTPCSQCVKDSWFQTFTAHPNTQRGVGLQASGYSTARDAFSGNTTYGNYEDTHFGRACYLPVTMLPLSHQKNINLQSQRQNRLKTQAAFYVNGYQKDWFGFNQGALIGSFDGVTWFAIGTGRRITASSTKLYLAINASFLDLADRTDTIVNIIPDFAANVAADFDYDPSLPLTDPRQNTAATCQKFHQCNTDSDCVTQLGWEYVCADVSQVKTKWPLFNSEAKETVNQERDGTLFEILQTTISTNTGKRCVYRGQGAPCKRDYSTLNDYNKKLLTCAPNFYCASLSSNKFNDELVRSPNELDDILFGMDANILGRPLNYVNANKTLSSEIIVNIKYNATQSMNLSSSDADDMGMCRPGRMLSTVDITAHSFPDTSKRTDYISQIGSCNSGTTGNSRFITCPAFNDELNYVDPNDIDSDLQKRTQNSCGGESKHTTNFESAFKFIEGLSLLSTQNIIQPTLVRDACFRRAGSVCHTDLDCGPNKMHEEAVGTMDLKYFGETEAEQQYWRESLVCGQGNAAPAKGTVSYLDYKLTDNRCCREIGKDFTMYTQGPTTIVPENTGNNALLKTTPQSDPSSKYRYSRYNISKNVLDDIFQTKLPKVSNSIEPQKDQWQAINETGSLTCCGGGWIRKFADGTHDWKIRNRLTLDSSNFNCLNFRSPLASTTYNSFTTDKVNNTTYQREFEYFCKSPDIGGCMQIPYQKSSGYTILSPQAYDPMDAVASDTNYGSTVGGYSGQPSSGLSRINTSPSSDPIDGSSSWYQFMNSDVPYMPIPFYYSPYPYDLNPQTNKAYNFFTNKTFDYGVEMYLPAYVAWDGSVSDPTFINAVYIKYFYDAPQLPTVVNITANLAPSSECNDVINVSGAASPAAPIDGITTNNTWCIISNAKTQNRPVMNVRADTSNAFGNWKYAGIIIDFKTVEKKRGTKVAEPGNALYYLSRLARLELLGIPQITYEPLYCNDNHDNLVPGIFKPAIKTRTLFTTSSVQYTDPVDPVERYNADNSSSTYESGGYGNSEKRFTFQNQIDHPQVFSSKDFTCCTPLGKNTTSAAKCCSGYAVASSDGKSTICKLPRGTDLNVYFNKFVSSEGVGAEQPGGGLVIAGLDTDIDFNPYTGEPKYRLSTYDKLNALGAVYCDGGKVATGGAFGAFPPEPFSGSYSVIDGNTQNLEASFPESIVDSVIDFVTSDPNVGKIPFDSGFKWNHHYYCK